MKFFISLIIIFITASTLDAYSRSVVIASYARYKDANTALTSTNKKYAKFAQISRYAKENNFGIVIRKTGKYFVIVAEPFFSKKSLNKALKRIKQDFKTPFITNYLGNKKAKEKVEIKKVEPKPILELKPKIKPQAPPKEVKKEVKINTREQNNQEMKELSDTKKCSWIFGCED